jgi:hypothetical protein
MEALPQDPIPKVKKPNGNIGRKPSEKQMEALRGGMAKLKAKREQEKVKKEEKKARKERGEPDSSEDEAPAPAPAPVVPPKPKKLISQDTLLEVIPLKPARVRKPRVAKEPVPPEKKYATREDFEAFKSQMFETIKTTPMIKEVSVDKIVEKEVVREVPVERVVEKRLTGSAMLDSIFFK